MTFASSLQLQRLIKQRVGGKKQKKLSWSDSQLLCNEESGMDSTGLIVFVSIKLFRALLKQLMKFKTIILCGVLLPNSFIFFPCLQFNV